MKKYSLLFMGLLSFVVIEQSTSVLLASYGARKSVQGIKSEIQAFIHMPASINPAGKIVAAIATKYTLPGDWDNYIYLALTELKANPSLIEKVKKLWEATIGLQE